MSHKPEQQLNDKIMNAIRTRHPVRVENTADPGTPDINLVDMWIESKCIGAWPKRSDTIVRVPHYRPDQRAWQIKRRGMSGTCFVVLQVVSEVFVFDANEAAQHLGIDWTHDDMLSNALLWMRNFHAATFAAFIDWEAKYANQAS